MDAEMFCVICCYSFPEGNGLSEEDKTVVISQLKLFCETLEEPNGEDNEVFSASSFTSMFQESSKADETERLSVCSECNSLISSAVNYKDMMINTEVKVRSLQLEILKELRTLQGHTEGYCDEFLKIEDVIRDSDLAGLQGRIDKEKEEIREWMERDIGLFRERIFQVTRQLESYQGRLISATSIEGQESDVTEEDDDVLSIHSNGETMEVELEPNLLSSDGAESDESFHIKRTKPHSSKPKRNRIPLKRYKRKLPSVPIGEDSEINLESMGPYKRDIVERSIKRMSQNRAKTFARKLNLEEDDIEIKFHLNLAFPLHYVGTEDKLLIGDSLEILINEEEKRLECSLCGFFPNTEAEDYQIMQSCMIQHVFKKHMDLFPCPIEGCGVPSKNAWLYKQHLKTHKGLKTNQCEICGKPITSHDQKAYHRWTHLNEEERAEALMNGEKPPWAFQEEYGGFQCEQCGKPFATKNLLNQHRRTHMKDRSMIVCPKCGKKMLKRNYEHTHKRYFCQGEDNVDERKVQCNICNVTLGNIRCLQRHLILTHDAERSKKNFQCDECGMAFKEQRRLREHKFIVHEGIRPFICSKGCGMDFNAMKSKRRHEDICKGRIENRRRWKGGKGKQE